VLLSLAFGIALVLSGVIVGWCEDAWLTEDISRVFKTIILPISQVIHK
jgi:hypothetical protein